ncbi:nucleoside recognition domain-containing protein [Porphyromonas sp. COT-239 OH1446]|uniref:nucleoside recognition domain-containing protein n=1 Tax=Porphyromonas sp. COT-239 OH1446 TaxID=1515613 RepID=UPI00052B79EE|nr:spore maturation protein [Porphyromonas sp. COT-239 OH1446]KGN72203.1 membrane protein [Porphyromonas sp. COT-239 OH1446]
MTLHYIFVGFFVVALLMALGELLLTGSFASFDAIVQSSFAQAKNGFEISLYLTGMLCLWLGLLKVAERSGLVSSMARRSTPVLSALFPSLPKDHPALGNIFMNISANMLGLDNAATPLGLKAMQELQGLNQDKSSPSDAMLMFLALNASGLTIIPTSIIAYRMQVGAANPADIFLPILMATTASTLVAVLLVALRQGINLLQRPLLLTFGAILGSFGLILWAAKVLPAETFGSVSTGVASMILLSMMTTFLIIGARRGLNVYDTFVEGAKEGFSTAVTIIPYLVAMLVGIGVFRASGGIELIERTLRWLVAALGWDTSFVEALPTILMKPLSGSGARGLMVDAMQTHGADSFVGRLCCTVQGASDTTFYVIALYLGSVGIRRSSYVVGYSLLADLAGAITAILVTYLFFT